MSRAEGPFYTHEESTTLPNRQLSPEELVIANQMLARLRNELTNASNGDAALLFAFRRKVFKELTYDERGKPMIRRALKAYKAGEQSGRCALCSNPLPDKYAVLDRVVAMLGYTRENTRLICVTCDTEVQAERKYS